MYANITSHNVKTGGTSSRSVFEYLDKENQKIRESGGREEFFFNQSFNPHDLDDPNSKISIEVATEQIDNNRGTQNNKLSNFYMLNISPSWQEQEHMLQLAEQELERKGLNYDAVKQNPEALSYYLEQRDELMKVQMKLYTKEVMNEYARLMDREIYANQDKLPNLEERKEMQEEIDRRYLDFLKNTGVELKEKEEILPEKITLEYKETQVLDKGAIFTFYDNDKNANYNLYVPNEKFELAEEPQKVTINEEYFANKYSKILQEAEYKNQTINISEGAKVEESKENFKDYAREDKIAINYHYAQFDKELKLYFSKEECTFVNGHYEVKEKILEDKIYQAKVTFLNKQFAEERQNIFENRANEKGYDFTKIKNENGKEIYLNATKVPKGNELKTFNTEVSIEFNKFLEEKGYLKARKNFRVSEWGEKEVNATFLLKTEKAVLTRIDDERLKEPIQIWIPNYIVKSDIEISDPPTESKVKIIAQFYEHKINEQIELQNSKSIEIEDYKEISSIKEINVKNRESIVFSYEIEGLKNPLSFQIEKEKLGFENGNYTMSRVDFETRYKAHLLEHCKKEFKADYERIQADVSQRLAGEQQSKIERETDKEFKNYLIEKNIYTEERDDKFKVQGEIEKRGEYSSMIKIKPQEYEEEVKLWVNNKDLSQAENGEIVFKNQEQAQKLIEKAIERDKEQKEMKPIQYDSFKVEELKAEEGKEAEKMYVFERREEGLKDPIKFSFKESELKREGEEFLAKKYSLEYREEKAKERAIEIEHGSVKNQIKEQVWQEKGFDTTKRKITGEDLLYFAKVETERTYKHTDKAVLRNRETLKEIKEEEAKEKPDIAKINLLKSKLEVDRHTGEVIKEGAVKGGLNYHTHVIVSRHDRTNVHARDKVSMSPNANNKEGRLGNGAKIGFHRDEFFKSMERIFDERFEYERPQQERYERRNELSKSMKEAQHRVEGMVKNKLKQEIYKHTGINTIRQEIDPRQKIKNAIMPLPLPTSFPTSKVDLIIKAVKMMKNLVVDKGIHY